MSGGFVIRRATIDDVEAMLVVHVSAIIAHGPSAYSDKQVAAWAAKTDGTDRYADAIESQSMAVVVAESSNRIVGFGELDSESGEVESVFVDPEWGGQGIGSAMLEHFETQLREDGYETVRVRSVLNAVDFYKQQGYERVERVTNQTTNGVEAESIWMEKPL
jgi:putative acetyltransferase